MAADHNFALTETMKKNQVIISTTYTYMEIITKARKLKRFNVIVMKQSDFLDFYILKTTTQKKISAFWADPHQMRVLLDVPSL